MPTFFKTESGQLINLDNVAHIDERRCVRMLGDVTGTYSIQLSKNDQQQIELLFFRSNEDAADNAQSFGSFIYSRLEDIAESIGGIADALTAKEVA